MQIPSIWTFHLLFDSQQLSCLINSPFPLLYSIWAFVNGSDTLVTK